MEISDMSEVRRREREQMREAIDELTESEARLLEAAKLAEEALRLLDLTDPYAVRAVDALRDAIRRAG